MEMILCSFKMWFNKLLFLKVCFDLIIAEFLLIKTDLLWVVKQGGNMSKSLSEWLVL